MRGYRLKRPFRHIRLKSLTLFPKPHRRTFLGAPAAERRPTQLAAGIMIGMECGDALQLHKPRTEERVESPAAIPR